MNPPDVSEKPSRSSSTNDIDGKKEQGGEDSRPLPSESMEDLPPVPFLELFRLYTPFELTINLLGLVAAAAAGAAQPLMAFLFGNLTNAFIAFGADVANGNDTTESAARFKHVAGMNALYIACVGIGMGITTWSFMFIWTYTGEVNAKRLRERYLQAVLRQDISYFDGVGAGEVATRIQNDTHLVQQGTSEKVALGVEQFGQFITGFAVAYSRSWRLSLALTGFLVVQVLTGLLMSTFMTKWAQASLRFVAEGGTLAEEVISTIRTAHAFGSQKTLSALYEEKNVKAVTADLKTSIAHGIGFGLFYFEVYAMYALAFYYGTTLILRGQTDVGSVVNVFMAILVGSYAVVLIAPELQAISQARGAAAKLYATLNRVPDIDSASKEGAKPKIESVQGKITLDNVVFHYPSRPNVPILHGLSLEIEAGKTTALVGPSGSGKSTIVSLVERFYDPISGSVFLDGMNLKDLNLTWLRSQIGLVSQEPTLFATTIRENVIYGLLGSRFESETDEEKFSRVQEACKKANAHDFITALPDGYNTMVGERGFLLSGGQKQRIAIARAIISDPRILLLDEATSALDTQSEGIVQNALDKAAAGRTTIAIAHRLSTIKDADRIYVMGGGRLLEDGTHVDLLAQSPDGPYAQLVAAQKLRDVEEARHQEVLAHDLEEDNATDSVTSDAAKAPLKNEPVPTLAEDMNQPLREYSISHLLQRMGNVGIDHRNLFAWGSLGAILVGFVYPAFGLVFARAVTAFQVSLDTEAGRQELRFQGDRNALWLFVISLSSTIAIFVEIFCFSRFSARLGSRLRTVVFKNILRQDIQYFDDAKNSTGALTSGLSSNPQKVMGLAGVTFGSIIQSLSTVVSGVALGLAFAPRLAAVAIATLPFVLGSGYIRLKVVILKDQLNKEAHDESAQMACEAVGAIRTVASLTRQDQCCELYSKRLEVPLRTATRSSFTSTLAYAISQMLSFFVIALVFWYGSTLVADLQYSTDEFYICLMSIVFASAQAGTVFGWVPDMSAAKGGASGIVRLLDSHPRIDAESKEGSIPSDVRGEMHLENIHFHYPTRPSVKVLRGLDITIKPGTFVAMVGASGCGKSTTLQLLERFYDPLRGRVLMDGVPIDQHSIQEYRKHLALVSQEPMLYAGTIRFNILLGAAKPIEDVSQEEIEEACRKANILEFILSLPDGFDTDVGGKGAQLSGGQKQRVAIARALLRNPKVLLLDEATSALDSQSEKVVQDALDQAARGRTTIAIAHRLSSIQNADCIYFLRDGSVLESGTHDQLSARRGAYWEYTQQQSLSNGPTTQ